MIASDCARTFAIGRQCTLGCAAGEFVTLVTVCPLLATRGCIDFLVSDLAAYRQLRQALTGADGLAAITRAADAMSLAFQQAGELRTDQYDIECVQATLASTAKELRELSG